MVPAAGRGSRLGLLTRQLPKALLEIRGRPILYWLLQRLRPAVARVCLVVQGPDSPIQRRFGNGWQGLRVHYAFQPEPLGVADAVWRARDVVQGPFVVAMGDVYYGESLAPYIGRWRGSSAEGAVLLEAAGTRARLRHPVGHARVAGDRVIDITKSVEVAPGNWRVCGLTILPSEAFEASGYILPGEGGELEIEDVVAWLMSNRNAEFLAIPYSGWRRNINTPSDLQAVRARARCPKC